MITPYKIILIIVLAISQTTLGQGAVVGATVITADLEDAVTTLMVTSAYNGNRDVDLEMVSQLKRFQKLYSKRNLYKIANVIRLGELDKMVKNMESRLEDLSNRNQSILLKASHIGPFRINDKVTQLNDDIEGVKRRLDLFKDLPNKFHTINIISGERTILIQNFKRSLDIIGQSVSQLESSTHSLEHILDKLYQSGKSIFK